MLPLSVISRYSNTYAKKRKRLGIGKLPLGRLQMVISTYSNILLSVNLMNMTKDACTVAAKNGHLDCLKYLHETAKAPWDLRRVQDAHENDHPECLQYLLDNNCPLPPGWSLRRLDVIYGSRTLALINPKACTTTYIRKREKRAFLTFFEKTLPSSHETRLSHFHAHTHNT